MGCFFPSSNVNVDLASEEKSNLIKSGHCCRQCLSIVPCLSDRVLFNCIINYLLCFSYFFISLYRLLVWVLRALFVICLSLKDLIGFVNCLIACVYLVQILKMATIHCAALTWPGYSRVLIFSTQVISSLFLWAVNVKWSVYLPYFAGFWLKFKYFYKI